MKILPVLIVATCCSIAVTPASAGSQTGTVKGLYLRDSDGLIWLDLSGTPSGRAPCAVGTTYWIIPNETTDRGKRLYATLLAAQLSGRDVSIVGKNACGRWPDGEDIDTIGVHGVQ